MGSPLSPVVANLYMEAFEEKALKTFPIQPKLWIRYGDDTFVLWPHGEESLNEFHQHLNEQHPAIQFTREVESEKRIAFLDVLVNRVDNRVSFTVYRKNTHTDRYIHFTSHHHPRVLSGVIKCLKNRADKICDTKGSARELSHLRKVFQANGYPREVIEHSLNPRRTNRQQTNPPSSSTKKILLLPYIKGLSEEIQRRCKNLSIKTIFKSSNTIRSLLTKVKTPQPTDKKVGVVYEIPCMDCDSCLLYTSDAADE